MIALIGLMIGSEFDPQSADPRTDAEKRPVAGWESRCKLRVSQAVLCDRLAVNLRDCLEPILLRRSAATPTLQEQLIGASADLLFDRARMTWFSSATAGVVDRFHHFSAIFGCGLALRVRFFGVVLRLPGLLSPFFVHSWFLV